MKVTRSSNRLYKICIKENRAVCLLTKAEEVAWLWHSRLGHVNFQTMQYMCNNEMAHGLPNLIHPKEVCKGCLLSKQARKPFPGQSNFGTTKVLQLLHGDLCGPITPSTPAGSRFFLLLVDDHSRMMWVFTLKSKDETFGAFKRFKAMVERNKMQKIQVLRTDKGGEFCSQEFFVVL